MARSSAEEELDAPRKGAAAGSAGSDKLFNDEEKAALALTRELTKKIAVSPATLKKVRSFCNDQQTVELIGTIAGYNMVSRFVVATGVERE